MAIYTKTPNGWEAIAQDAKAVSSFGSIVPDGNQTDEGTYTDSSGREWVWYEWTDPDKASSFTTDGGLLWCLVVGGGDGGWNTSNNSNKNGQPGNVREGFWEFDAGVRLVHVGDKGATNSNPKGEPSYIDDVLTGFSVQTDTDWGETSQGRGIGKDGYKSLITGDEREYSPAYDRPLRPGRGGYEGGEQQPGCVIVATVVNGGKPKPVAPSLTPATVVSAPIVVESDQSVSALMVRDLQDKRKILYVLPGSVNDYVLNSYSVELTAGRLRGLMIASGGTSGSAYNTGGYGGGGGAGGIVGWGRLTDIYIPVDGTYTFTIGGHNPRGAAATTAFNDVRNGQNSTLTGPGGVVSVAVGGGHGGNLTSGNIWGPPGQGGSGGGGYYVATNPPKSAQNGTGIPGQGFDGALATSGGGGGGGAGGFPTGDAPVQAGGGPGVNVFDLLEIDPLKDNAPMFSATFTDSGYVGGGGAGFAGGPDYPMGGIGGGGAAWYNGGTNVSGESDRDGKDMMGAGGGGSFNTNGVSAGGCGMVILVGDI